MKKVTRKTVMLAFILVFAISTVAQAVSENAYFDGTNKVYSPDSGSLNASYFSNYVQTTLYFKYSQERVDYISDYRNMFRWAGVDVKCDPGMQLGDTMDAYSVTTTLPDPKTDLEGGETGYNHESEAVAQGDLTANKTYWMTTNWHDYRPTSDNGKTGRWTANAELCAKGVGDYNTDDWESLTQIPFNGEKGEP